MEINKILQADYLDLIFDNRNKNYGSYDLRKHYQSRAVKALGLMLSSLILAVTIPYFIGLGNHGNNIVSHAATDIVIDMKELVYLEKIIPPTPRPAETHNVSVAKTIKITPPVIVENSKVPEVKPPEIKNPETAIVGAANNDGNGGIHSATTTKPPSGPPGDGGPYPPGGEIGGGEPIKDIVVISTDVPPEYPGGMAALLEYLQRNIRYPNEARENQIQGRVVVRFVVNKEGKIEGAEVQKGIGYGCDKEALRVVNAMKTWKPGQVKGKAVKAYYTLPITFRLDQ